MALTLLIILAERMSVVATIAFIMAQTRVFRRIVNHRITNKDKWTLAIVFGLVGIVGTYTGIPIHDALANSRVIGVMVAGLLGGPMVGLGAGLIAGGHRLVLGGFTAFACALASVVEGGLGGLFYLRYGGRPVPWQVALLAGLGGEILQMGIILLTARPFPAAWELVQVIGLPMILVNGVGIAVFMVIVKTAMEQEQRVAAVQAQKALEIATCTLPFLRQGLNRASAEATVKIIYEMNNFAAVSITNTEEILAHIGVGEDHHRPGYRQFTLATQQALTQGTIQVADSREAIGCAEPGCKLARAVVVPLKRRDTVVGTLKLYHEGNTVISTLDLQLAAGLAHLFSTQLELAEVDYQAKLAARAELKALQAQINPHFLFNALNTIVALVRINPDTARELLIKLSHFFRHNFQKAGRHIPLAEELAYVDAYLAIEKARFGDKLSIRTKVAPTALHCLVPAFILQPLVENAVKHGLQPRREGGQVAITVDDAGDDICIMVHDDGVGISPADFPNLCLPGFGCGNGIGLSNVHERLKSLYGAEYGLSIASIPGRGTKVTFRIPKAGPKEDECDVAV